VTSGAYQMTNNDQTGNSIGGFNAFVTELNPTGTSLVYSTYLGGNGINQGSFTDQPSLALAIGRTRWLSTAPATHI